MTRLFIKWLACHSSIL